MDFHHKVALITGGSSGIGLALAKELAARDTRVFICGRDSARLQQALAGLPPGSAGAHGMVAADVSDPQQAQRLVETVLQQSGGLDILINSAGVVHPGYTLEMNLEKFHWMMDINYFGTLYVTKALLPCLVQQRSGYIVNIGSFLSWVGVLGYSAYAASKFAVRGFSDVLRMELKPHGIKVSIVYPPDTDTPQLAYESQYRPDEVRYLLPEFGVVSAEKVARAAIRGMQREQYEIVPDLGSKVLISLSGLVGGLRYVVLDWLLARAQARIRREAKN